MEETDLLLTEKHDFEELGDSKLKTFQCVCGHQDYTARIQIKNSSIESSTTNVRLSIDTSMREIKPEATQNFKFED